MTPEEVRRILDPERRRAGFDAWKAEQREKARAGFEPAPSPLHEGSSTAGVQPLVELPRREKGSTVVAPLRTDVAPFRIVAVARPRWMPVYDKHCPPGFRLEWHGQSVDGLRVVAGDQVQEPNQANR